MRWRLWWWRLPHLAWLAGLWVLLWGDVAVGVVLAGVALAVVVLASWPRTAPLTHTVHPVAALRFVVGVAADIVRANVVLAVEVLTPTDRTAPGLVDVRLPDTDPAVVAATSQAVNLAPGTVVVGQPRPDVLRIHALYLRDPELVARHIEHLARLADAALIPHPAHPSTEPRS